jgi:large subunit ribosomal protein L24
MLKIKQGDEIIVITGKDKGKRGKVIRLTDTSKVLVENVNLVNRHTKPNPGRNRSGGIIQKEMPIHISNVALINPNTNKPDKVGFKFLVDGRKVRYFKSDGEVIEN